MCFLNIFKGSKSASVRQEKSEDKRGAYIRDLVERAGKFDSERTVFGSSRHQYRLNPVIALEKVIEFEEKYHVTLPEEYKFFLTKVGNGGAGPYYGLYSLEQLETNEHIGECGNKAWIDNTLTKDSWTNKMNILEDAEGEAYDKLISEISSGFNVIGTQGCTYDNLLMNNGSEKGKIVYIDWNLLPDDMPYFTGMSFLDWYETFFKEIISGNTVTSYGYIRLGSEDELISVYNNPNTSEQEQQAIIMSFYRFSKVSENTKQFLLDIDNRNLDAIRTELLLRFDIEKGIRLFEKLLNGTNQEGAIMCARRLPKAYFNRYYKKILKLLYCVDIPYKKIGSSNCKDMMLYFLKDCKDLKAADLVDFATDLRNFEQERRTAIYVMGQAKDKISCLPYFIDFMKNGSYWVAHASLQAMSKVVCPELVEVYELMWIKYENDETMRSNLIRAFKTNGITKGR